MDFELDTTTAVSAAANQLALMPDFLDPMKLLGYFGTWALVGLLVVIFVESGVLFPVLPGDSLLFVAGMLAAGTAAAAEQGGDLEREDPALVAAFRAGDPGFAFPGGESTREQTARTRVALGRIGAGPLPAVAVTHAGIIRAALALHGRPVPPEASLPHGGLTRLEDAP